MKTIYSVTSIHTVRDTDRSGKRFTRSDHHRCWGWFSTLKKAKSTVKSCGELLHDIEYQYVLIEASKEGLLNVAGRVQWYKLAGEPGDKKWKTWWEACPCPDWAKQLINWSVG